jgi:2-amino-4-hydroxy-6-hydroxymethyldihydropteridine diphosphokinase
MDTSILAYIAFGSNLGDRRKNIFDAIEKLKITPEIRVLRVSALIENPAVGSPAGSPDFLNGVAEIETNLPPRDLLHQLHEIERSLGRVRRDKWEPRIIDLDLLLYGDEIIHTFELTVPHPLMHTRRFVLQPIAELAPDRIHPTQGVTIAKLLQNLADPAGS